MRSVTSRAAILRSRGTAQVIEQLEARIVLSLALNGSGAGDLQDVINLAKDHFAVPGPIARPAVGSAAPTGLTPAQVRGAYGVGTFGAANITFGAIQGDGSGQTIAIVDAYDYPTAAADLHSFSVQFGLPDPPSFTRINQNGAASPLPGTDPGGPLGWSLESALDIQWAHAMAPKANIILVECNSPSLNDLLIHGVPTAAAQPGVSVVSMSFGAPEFSGVNTLNFAFTTPVGHNPVTFLASTGDTGSPSGYPAYAQNVIAVGGTTLNVSGNSYVGETGWSGSGGGISTVEYQPSYQTPFFASAQRTNPDVSMVADPATGVSVIDTFDLGTTTPWITVGGTSLATPLFAGLMAVANQGRIINGLSTLDGGGQTLPILYGLPASDFHDVTSGSNGGFSATAGYDLVTGRGSPKADLLVPALATAAAPALLPDLQPVNPGGFAAPLVVSTASFVDTDPSMLLAGDPVFLDTAWINNGQTSLSTPYDVEFFDNGVSIGTSSATGTANPGDILAILDAPIGNMPTGFTEFKMVVDTANAVGESTETNNTYIRTYIVDNTANRNYALRIDPAVPSNVQVLVDGAPSYSVNKNSLNGLLFYLSGSNETLTIDATNGNPIPITNGVVANGALSSDKLFITGTSGADTITLSPSSIGFNGTSVSFLGEGTVTVNPAGGTDSLTIIGASGNNNISVSATQIQLNSLAVPYSNLETLKISTGNGDDTFAQTANPAATMSIALGGGINTFNLDAGSFTFASDAQSGSSNLTVNVATGASVFFGASQHLAGLHLNGGLAVLASGANKVLVTPVLTFSGNGALDLTDEDAIIPGGSLSSIESAIATGFNGGTWTGNAIRSSTAATVASNASNTHKTGLGYAVASSIGAGPTFDGQTISGSAVLIRYTNSGDANLDGNVNSMDFSALSANFNGSAKVWSNGDFNYSTVANALDFNAMASNFGQVLPSPPVASLFSVTQLATTLRMDSAASGGYKFPNRPIDSNGFDDLEAELTL